MLTTSIPDSDMQQYCTSYGVRSTTTATAGLLVKAFCIWLSTVPVFFGFFFCFNILFIYLF